MWLPSPSPLLCYLSFLSLCPISSLSVSSHLVSFDLFSLPSISSRLLWSLLFSFILFSYRLITSFLFRLINRSINRSVLVSYLFSSFNLFPSHLLEFPLVLSPSISFLLFISFDLFMPPSVFHRLLQSLLSSPLLSSPLLSSPLLSSPLLSLPALSDDSLSNRLRNTLSNLCRKAWGIVVIAHSRRTEGYWFQLDLTRTDKDKTVLSYNHVKHVLTEEFIQVSQDDYRTMSSMVRKLQFIFVSCSCSELPHSLYSRILLSFVSLGFLG